MTIKDIKQEARKKLALNMHQAIAIYTIEFTIVITLIALVVMSALALDFSLAASIVMICYGGILALIAAVCSGLINFAMVDHYLASYKCKPYNIRRLGETLARSGVTKIFAVSFKRTMLAFLLLLLLIVPGVIYIIRTSMANYLIIANPKMKGSTALSASSKIMSGKTGSYFALCMSLFGWYMLGVLSLGLGFIFILPYTNLIKAVYYKRNLQGDKAEYQIAPQPISPPVMQTGYAAGQPGAVDMRAAPQVDPRQAGDGAVRPVVFENSPMDTLGEDDIRDINETMRDLGDNSRPVDIPEVAIATASPKTKKKDKKTASVTDNVVAEPVFVAEARPEPVQAEEPAEEIHIDGTNLVESERVLSTMELDAAETARQQAIDAVMHSTHTDKKVEVDYFGSPMGNESPDDFVTNELLEEDVDAIRAEAEAEAEISPQDSAADETPVTDSEFDDILKTLQKEVSIEPEQPEPQPQPTPRPEPLRRPVPERPSASAPPPVRPSSAASSTSGEQAKPDPSADRAHRSQVTAAEIAARAERIKREREERLKQNNGK